jgi:hypothetical protein
MKQRPKKSDSGFPQSDSVYVVDRENTVATNLALMEQLFEMMADSDRIAKFLASELREGTPKRELLDMVARMLDPGINDYFKLVVARRRGGKTWTRQANDAALAKAAIKWKRALGNKHGDQKKAVAKTAKQFEVSKATVLKALRSK